MKSFLLELQKQIVKMIIHYTQSYLDFLFLQYFATDRLQASLNL